MPKPTPSPILASELKPSPEFVLGGGPLPTPITVAVAVDFPGPGFVVPVPPVTASAVVSLVGRC